MRLVNGSKPTEGRLEVLHDGMWGSVCSRQFGNEEARVVCRTLGYRYEHTVRVLGLITGHITTAMPKTSIMLTCLCIHY